VRFVAIMAFIPYGHKPQNFITNIVSTDTILVAWQNTVYEPPEDGINNGPKHVWARFKCFNPIKRRLLYLTLR